MVINIDPSRCHLTVNASKLRYWRGRAYLLGLLHNVLFHPHHPAHAESLQLGEASDLPMLHSTAKEKGGLAKMLMGPEKAVSLDSLERKKLGKGIVKV